MMFSVIIPTRHRDNLLAQCLDRLVPGRQSIAGDAYEVIVTDDGTQSTGEKMINEMYPWARWVAGPHRGPAANRNHGVSVARAAWLVFTDDDCLPDHHWLRGYAEAIEAQPKFNVLEGKVYANGPKRSLSDTSPINECGGYLWSCNFAIRANTFTEVGGFDERFLYAAMEDVELATRLRKRAEGVLFVPEASICHPWRPIGGWKRFKQHQKATLCFLELHPEQEGIINTAFYLRMMLRTLARETLPGLVTMRGEGFLVAVLQYCAWLQTAWLLSMRTKHKVHS